MDRTPADFLREMARRYCWDMPDPAEGAAAAPDRVIRRVMDLGAIEDAFALEPILGRDRLVAALRTAPPGALRPRSWWFWHYRLHLADADHDPPPMPVRTDARANLRVTTTRRGPETKRHARLSRCAAPHRRLPKQASDT